MFALHISYSGRLIQNNSSQSVPSCHPALNAVAGFIGPEVFRTREQLVRCCLEDIVMGKLHGLTIGLDICSTLHMDVNLDDLDWCIEQIILANPAYITAASTSIWSKRGKVILQADGEKHESKWPPNWRPLYIISFCPLLWAVVVS